MAVTITTTNIEGTIKARANLFSKNKKNKFSQATGYLPKGDKVVVSQGSSNGYYYVETDEQGNVGLWVKKKAVSKTSTKFTLKKENKNDYAKTKASLKASISNTDDSLSKLLVRSLNGIHGAPYQFMHTCDAPVDKRITFGRKYIERVVSKMPLLLMSPGKPDFMPSFSKKQKTNLLKLMLSKKDMGDNALSSNIKTLLGKNSGRYYTFDFDFASYYKYVNAMLRYCSVCLGISKVKHYTMKTAAMMDADNMEKVSSKKLKRGKKPWGKKLGSFKWQKAVNFDISGTVSSYEYVAFYLDSETSISESLSNSSTEPGLASTFNTLHGSINDIQFIAGGVAGLRLTPEDADEFNNSKSKVVSTVEKHVGSSKLLTHLDEMFRTVASNGMLIFPEIWENSEFSKSYSVSMKLRTPDGDKISWFLNICVPMIHLLALAAPKALGPNGYASPFLVRAYYKGIFNCDMGLITSMTISKGKDAAWTVDGLPTEVDISLEIKDLYQMLTISNAKGKVTNFFRNTCLIDYLSSTCGININKPELARLAETYTLFAKNKLADTYGDAWLSLNNFTSNVFDNLYSTALFKQ